MLNVIIALIFNTVRLLNEKHTFHSKIENKIIQKEMEIFVLFIRIRIDWKRTKGRTNDEEQRGKPGTVSWFLKVRHTSVTNRKC